MGATRIAICVALVVAHTEARASECAPPSPECHLENGLQLLGSDPKRASEELLASYKLDERTDTLALYATALQKAGRYALALETWKRIIVFREGELGAAKAAARRSTGRKQAAAKSAVARIQKQSEAASEAIIKLWPKVGRVRIQFAPGQELAVWRDGVEVDASRDVLVNAGRDELLFALKEGGTEKVVVQVAAGASTMIDAPVARQPKPERTPAPKRIEQPKATQPEIKPEIKPEPEPEPTPPLMTVKLAEEPRSRAMSRVGMVLVGGAIIAGGVAGGLGYLADRDLDRSRDAGCNAAGQCPFGPAADLAQRSNDRARLAQISAIGGGALLATGVTLWIIGRGKTRRVANDVTVHVSHSSAAVGWRF